MLYVHVLNLETVRTGLKVLTGTDVFGGKKKVGGKKRFDTCFEKIPVLIQKQHFEQDNNHRERHLIIQFELDV